MTFSPANASSAYLPTTTVWSEDLSQFLQQMTKRDSQIAIYVNQREIGLYQLVENLTGQQFFNVSNFQQPRQVFRTVYNIGAIASNTTSTTAHNITPSSNLTFTRIYGTYTIAGGISRPLPYVSTTNVTNQVSIEVDATNITIVTGSTASAITSCIVVLEYTKN